MRPVFLVQCVSVAVFYINQQRLVSCPAPSRKKRGKGLGNRAHPPCPSGMCGVFNNILDVMNN